MAKPSFDLDGVSYSLVRRKRQKHINIRVHHNGQVTVSAPYGTSNERIREAVLIKKDWIRRHVSRALEMMSDINELSSIPFLGDSYSIRITFDDTRRGWIKADFDAREILLRTASRSRVKRSQELSNFLKRQSKKLIQPEVDEISQKAGISIDRTYFRDQKTRWGSSSARGNISLNWRIVLLPFAIRRYLIIHELAHQVHMNHSPKFWGIVASMCPEYVEYDLWLKEHAYLLGLYR